MTTGTDGARPSTPRDALLTLLAGNQRFVTGMPEHPNQDARRRASGTAGQDPFAVVLGCSDSRVAAEIVFDRGLGDLFVVRTAGHMLGREVVASIEFAVTALHTPLVVVLGHDSCGAVAAAIDAHDRGVAPSGHLRVIAERLGPEVRTAAARGISDRDDIARLHIESTAALLLEQSTPVRTLTADGRCAVVGLTYTLADGRVEVTTVQGDDSLAALPPV